MATNIVHEDGDQLFRKITVPSSGAKAGDPVLCGVHPGVALTDQDADGYATVKFNGSASLSVKGVDQSGNSAVAEGDVIYLTSGDTPKLNKKNTGVRYGYAGAGVVGSNQTATITVDLGY
jgi:predicted RecA/RadA family phage recombinase